MARAAALALALVLTASACDPSTTRPTFAPFPEADTAHFATLVPDATRRLADALRADSVPVSRVHPRDGYIETPWIDLRTGRRAAAGAVGDSVVRVRAWVDPFIPKHSRATVETAVRARLDPSLPPRELEVPAAPLHPMVARVRHALSEVGEK
jgi:hypothetical protein